MRQLCITLTVILSAATACATVSKADAEAEVPKVSATLDADSSAEVPEASVEAVHQGGSPNVEHTEASLLERFLKIRTPISPTLSPDGRLYVLDWPDGLNQLYRREDGLDSRGELTQLTDYEHGVNRYSLSPDGSWVVLAVDSGGDEQWDLHVLDTQTDEITPLKVDPRVRYRFQKWLPDSGSFIYAANDEEPTDFYLYRHHIAEEETDRVFAGEGYWFTSDVTSDGSRMLIGQFTSVASSEAFELDVASGELRSLRLREGYYHSPLGYLHDERSIALLSDATDSGRRRVHVICARGEEISRPIDLNEHEVEGWTTSLDRSLVAVRYNDSGYTTLRLYRLPGFKEVELPPIERGVVYGVSLVESMLLYTLNNARTPGVTFAVDLEEEEKAAVSLTTVADQGVDLSAFELPRLIHYESFDGKVIPAFLFLPPGYEEGTPIPFVAHYHGGPESQFRPYFHRQNQYLLSRGYGVIQPNVRGSTGYGRAFHMADVYKKRWNSVRDGVEAVRWLIDKGYTKEGMVASFGASYGGFMAVATVIEGQDLFGAAINRVGIVNFRTFLERTRGYRRHLREEQYGPLEDRQFLESISPINRIDAINVPMMIVHGVNDPRVPLHEAIQLAVGLQRRGQDPELLFFHDEGHGLSRFENRLLFVERLVRFLDRHIGHP